MPRPILIVLEVTDLGRSAAFYRDGFGLELEWSDHSAMLGDLADDRWISGPHASASWFDGGYLHFSLYQAKGEPTRGAQIGFFADYFDEAHARALAAGAIPVHEPRSEPWGATVRYLDPDGNIVSLSQRQ